MGFEPWAHGMALGCLRALRRHSDVGPTRCHSDLVSGVATDKPHGILLTLMLRVATDQPHVGLMTLVAGPANKQPKCLRRESLGPWAL